MQWCLAEAKRCTTRAALKSAISMSIQEDKRKTRFLLRHRSCSSKLEVSAGVLCLSREVGDPTLNGADKLRAAALTITPRVLPIFSSVRIVELVSDVVLVGLNFDVRRQAGTFL